MPIFGNIGNNSNSSKTKYHDLYSKTYWGWGTYPSLTDDIVQNRNRFAEHYRLKRCLGDKVPGYIREYIQVKDEYKSNPDWVDHKECYLDQDNNYVWVVSPYSDHYQETLISLGWQPVDKLYLPSAFSYVKLIPRGCKIKQCIIGNHTPNFYRTKYPDLFRYTSWGRDIPKFSNSDSESNCAIYINRNTFVEQYEINKQMRYSSLPQYVRDTFDDKYYHLLECYMDQQKNYVLVLHAETTDKNKMDDEHAPICQGWQRMDGPLTATTTASYVKQVVAKKRRRVEIET